MYMLFSLCYFVILQTVEPAEEANMEAVNITTEQPGPVPGNERIGIYNLLYCCCNSMNEC